MTIQRNERIQADSQLISPTTGKGFGARYLEDPRDSKFKLSAALPRKIPKIRKKAYYTRTWLDQGTTPHCVGFAAAHWLSAGPKVNVQTADDAHKLYYEALKVDEWPGEADEGTSVRAGLKIAQNQGYIESYLWSNDTQVISDAMLAGVGPVIVGVLWFEGMSNPTNGIATPTGAMEGGHATFLHQINLDRPNAEWKIQNSWGRGWGTNGTALLGMSDLQMLLNNYGECCVPIERKVKRQLNKHYAE